MNILGAHISFTKSIWYSKSFGEVVILKHYLAENNGQYLLGLFQRHDDNQTYEHKLF